MNPTQKLITENFTIDHAKSTIKSLRDKAEQQIRDYDKKDALKELLEEGSKLEKLRTVYFNLDDLYKEVERVSNIINTIDNEN